jgi:hypothetical protein
MRSTNELPPGLDEQYLIATNTSNLTLNPDRVCAATHLIAAGLTGNRMGEALSHLRAEWDAADKPRKMTEAEILTRANDFRDRKGRPDVKRIRTEALLGYAVAMRHRAHALRGWLPALTIMGEWAQMRGVDVDLLSPALYHWLHATCPVCDGRGHRRLPEAPVLEKKQCYHCNGSGSWQRPLGAEPIHDWLATCIGNAQRDRKKLLHAA